MHRLEAGEEGPRPVIDRDAPAASREAWDLLVIGGGVHGVTLALEAARRGLRPLLVERNDFGGATTWNSLRIAHGGLRYLQSLDLVRHRDSVRERRWLLATYPGLVRPLACLMPLYGEGLRRPAVLRLALLADGILSPGRNAGLPAEMTLPRGRVLSAGETLRRAPSIRRESLRGGALWHDAVMGNPERLLMEMLRWAVACGGGALNYTEARRLLLRKGAVAGIEARDRISGETLELRAPLVVNCAGPWCREVARRLDRDLPRLFIHSAAFNVLLDLAPAAEGAVAIPSRARPGRHYFLLPWGRHLLAGTFHAAWEEGRSPGEEGERLVGIFLEDLARGAPGLGISREKVTRVLWGLLPAARHGTGETAVREVIHHHGDSSGPEGLFSVSGIKWTTARLVAERTLGRIFTLRGARLPPTLRIPPPARGPVISAEAAVEGLRSEREALAGTVRRLVREESVQHLDDLVLRRTGWGLDPRTGLRLGREVAGMTGWDPSRADEERQRLEGILGDGLWRQS